MSIAQITVLTPVHKGSALEKSGIQVIPSKSLGIEPLIGTCSIDQWIHIPAVPDQRNEQIRLQKMRFAFEKKHASLRHVAAAIIEKEFTIYNSDGNELAKVEPGVYRLDGNTRALFWEKYPAQRVTEPLIVHLFVVNSQAELELEYAAHDNMLAAESTSDKITGAYRKIGLSFQDKILRRGGISTAIKYAYPGGREASILDIIDFFKKELTIIDKFNLFEMSDSVKCQHLYTAQLMTLKYYSDPVESQRAVDGWSLFSKIHPDTAKDSTVEDGKRIGHYTQYSKWHPLAAIWHAYGTGQVSHLEITEGSNKVNCVKSTKFAHMNIQLDFILYLFDRYMSGKNITYTGIQPTNFKGTYDEWLKDLR